MDTASQRINHNRKRTTPSNSPQLGTEGDSRQCFYCVFWTMGSVIHTRPSVCNISKSVATSKMSCKHFERLSEDQQRIRNDSLYQKFGWLYCLLFNKNLVRRNLRSIIMKTRIPRLLISCLLLCVVLCVTSCDCDEDDKTRQFNKSKPAPVILRYNAANSVGN